MHSVALRAAMVLALLLAPAAAPAQEARPDTLARVVGRSVEELVAGLPGEPLGLDRVVAVALDQSLDLELARARRHLADAALRTERGLFDPSIVAGYGVARNQPATARTHTWSAGVAQALPWGTELGVSLRGVKNPAGVDAPVTQGTDLALSLSQPLLEGFGTLDTDVRVARSARRAAAADLMRAQDEVVAGVELAYWDLAEAEAVQAVLQRSLEIADALLFRNRQLADRELVPEVDVITARSGVALRRAGYISARQGREDAAERLVYLAWGEKAGGRVASAAQPVKTASAPTFEALPAAMDPASLEGQALELRQDVAAALADIEGAEALRRAARRAVLPSLTLEGSVTSAGGGLSLGDALRGLDEDRSWSLGLSFSQPILNRRDRGTALSADLGVELRRLSLALVENQVRLEIRSAARAVQAGRERLAAAREAATLAREQLEAERQRLELGLGDSFRLLETEENAVQAELEEVRARYDLARAATYYRLAMGTVVPG